jgi:hypothetical protein
VNGDARPQNADLEWRYITALDAEDRGDWTAAISSYDEILGIDPEYREAAARKQICQAQRQLIIHKAGPHPARSPPTQGRGHGRVQP